MTNHRPDHEVELFREGDQFVVVADLPGYDPEDIDLRWHDRRLGIHAERPTDGSGSAAVVHREVGLPYEADADAITAEYEDGLLEVTLPIREEHHTHGTRIDVE